MVNVCAYLIAAAAPLATTRAPRRPTPAPNQVTLWGSNFAPVAAIACVFQSPPGSAQPWQAATVALRSRLSGISCPGAARSCFRIAFFQLKPSASVVDDPAPTASAGSGDVVQDNKKK